MPRGTTTDRLYLTPGESGMGGELAASAIHEFSHRPPEGHVGALAVATNSPPPDSLWFVRLADWPPASWTKPRSGGSQPADGGTIFFEAVEEFAAEFHSNPRLGLWSSDAEPEREQQVILWMRSGDPTLRAATIDGPSPQKGTKINPEINPEQIEPIEEFDCQGHHEIPEPTRPTAQGVACPLLVWTLWTNPFS